MTRDKGSSGAGPRTLIRTLGRSRRLVALSGAAFLCAGGVWACQLTAAPPVTQLDPELVMIIGRVSGVVGPRQAADVWGEAWGLDVAVQDVGHGPDRIGRTVEVFEFNLSASCQAVGMGKEELLARFPPGSDVRLAAKRSQRAWRTEDSDGMILEGGPFHHSTVVSRILPREPIPASFASVYDFASPIDIASYEESHGDAADWFWYQGMVRFELLKELLRLTRAEDEGEVLAILERIRRNPLASRGEVSFPALVRTYLEDPSKAKALIGEDSEP